MFYIYIIKGTYITYKNKYFPNSYQWFSASCCVFVKHVNFLLPDSAVTNNCHLSITAPNITKGEKFAYLLGFEVIKNRLLSTNNNNFRTVANKKTNLI